MGKRINISDLIYSKNSSPYGISYSEWIGRWWQWHVSIQNKVQGQGIHPTNLTLAHPREAYSPEKCAWNQNDKNVWFLPDGSNLELSESGTPEIRKCTVPHDKALLVQIYGGGNESYGEGLKTEKELKDCVDIGLDTVTFTAKVDGVEVMSSEHRDDFRPEPIFFNLTYPQDNLYDCTGWNLQSDGWRIFPFCKSIKCG